MPDIRAQVVALLEYWGLIIGTVTLLLKSLQAVLTNRKSVKELSAALDKANDRIADLEYELAANNERTKQSIDLLMKAVFKI